MSHAYNKMKLSTEDNYKRRDNNPNDAEDYKIMGVNRFREAVMLCSASECRTMYLRRTKTRVFPRCHIYDRDYVRACLPIPYLQYWQHKFQKHKLLFYYKSVYTLQTGCVWRGVDSVTTHTGHISWLTAPPPTHPHTQSQSFRMSPYYNINSIRNANSK